ncbi:hypothetical protein B0H11DRAFT_2200097 [Mycena galericulata]|nr:hypothetical protein B0H11DRAFT_2200097 [Mycena galericulata]
MTRHNIGSRRAPPGLSHRIWFKDIWWEEIRTGRNLRTREDKAVPLAERLGYEVRVYARVPNFGDSVPLAGTRRTGTMGSTGSKGSTSRTSTESKEGQIKGGVPMGFPQAFMRSLDAERPVAGVPPSSGYPPSAGAMSTPPKIKYREQGVDELLQLKLHQALAALDGPPPPNATIDGFLGPVRTALKEGSRVELYAWEEGLSRAWMCEFGEWVKPAAGEESGRFKIVGMEQFAGELLEIY